MIKTQPQHVTVKSSADGISLKLDPDISFEQLLTEIRERFEESSAFFGGAQINLSIDGRVLSEKEREDIGKTIEEASYLHVVSIDRIPFESHQDKVPETEDDLDAISFDAQAAETDEESSLEETDLFEEEDEDILSDETDSMTDEEGELEEILEEEILESKLPDAQFIDHTLKNGEEFHSAHNIIVIGNVEQGACVISAKNIVVMGKLLGKAHAGYGLENSDNYIIALEIRPERLQIGGLTLNDKPKQGLFGARKGAYQIARKDSGMIRIIPAKL